MASDLASILRLDVPVIVQVCATDMTVEDVLAMTPGSIVELPKLADEEMEIMVNNKQIGTGRTVKVGGNFGVRVTWIGEVRDRIEAMGVGKPGGMSGDSAGTTPRATTAASAAAPTTADDGLDADALAEAMLQAN